LFPSSDDNSLFVSFAFRGPFSLAVLRVFRLFQRDYISRRFNVSCVASFFSIRTRLPTGSISRDGVLLAFAAGGIALSVG